RCHLLSPTHLRSTLGRKDTCPPDRVPARAPHAHRMGRKAPARGPTPLHSTPASTGSYAGSCRDRSEVAERWAPCGCPSRSLSRCHDQQRRSERLSHITARVRGRFPQVFLVQLFTQWRAQSFILTL